MTSLELAARRKRRIVIGVIAVAVTLACAAAAFAAVSPALSTPDETAHIDYGYQVWHGHLPVFQDGVMFKPAAGAQVPPVQWEAQHPPLYYVLIAPIVGPLIDSGHWQAAVMGARAVNILLLPVPSQRSPGPARSWPGAAGGRGRSPCLP